jgi:hypothetical protein
VEVFWKTNFTFPGRMITDTKIDEKLEGDENFRAWKYKVGILLEEHDLEIFVEEEVPKPEEDEAKEKHKKNQAMAKRIILDSIKDHLIHHVSLLNSPKKMMDALTQIFEGKNINKRMTLNIHMKNLKLQHSESIHSYFSKVNQIKEHIESIGGIVDKAEMEITTLNGLPRSWDSFIRGICSRRKLIKFSRLWEDCTQEEARMVAREEKLRDDDQYLATHTSKGKSNKEPSSPKKPQKSKKNQRDYSNVMCFCCERLGHIPKLCPLILKLK